jgi:hypothetical protein
LVEGKPSHPAGLFFCAVRSGAPHARGLEINRCYSRPWRMFELANFSLSKRSFAIIRVPAEHFFDGDLGQKCPI